MEKNVLNKFSIRLTNFSFNGPIGNAPAWQQNIVVLALIGCEHFSHIDRSAIKILSHFLSLFLFYLFMNIKVTKSLFFFFDGILFIIHMISIKIFIKAINFSHIDYINWHNCYKLLIFPHNASFLCLFLLLHKFHGKMRALNVQQCCGNRQQEIRWDDNIN